MLDQLPVEIIIQIASYLPTASAIINLSLTNRKLRRQLSSDENATFRPFVQRQFPTTRCPPFWKEAACLLTTRSRAWERRAFVAKALDPPMANPPTPGYFRQSGVWRTGTGYAPALDCYEVWKGSTWAERQEAFAWGAGGRLMVRVRDAHCDAKWYTDQFWQDDLPQYDILDVRLLRPGQRLDSQAGEEVIIRRANMQVTKFKSDHNHGRLRLQSQFDTENLRAECMSISRGSRPLVAVSGPEAIGVFDGCADEEIVQPLTTLVLQPKSAYKHRKRCSTFLDEDHLALGNQYLEGNSTAPIDVYRVRPHGISPIPEFSFDRKAGQNSGRVQTRINANTIVPLDDVQSSISRPAELVLSGWSDGVIRLYDRRAPEGPSMEYRDCVDDGQILSLLPIGHERFLAGGVQNACLKIFDFRVSGAKVYSYLAGRTSSTPIGSATVHAKDTPPSGTTAAKSKAPLDDTTSRRLNIFLAVKMQSPMPFRDRLPKQQLPRLRRYQGPVYSLVSPSPSSPTVYAGIENHVIQLDFVSTDDVLTGRPDLSPFGLKYGEENSGQILDLSCYERPRRGRESTDAVLLRNQVGWDNLPRTKDDGLTEDGWDERWRLASLNCGSSWRRGR